MTVIERRELQARARKRENMDILGGAPFQRWLQEQREKGYRVLLAADESHVLAVTADHNIRQGVIPA